MTTSEDNTAEKAKAWVVWCGTVADRFESLEQEAFYAGFDAGRASRDAEVAVLRERVAELEAQAEKLTTILDRIVEVANHSAIEGAEGFIWRYDMPPGPIHAAIKALQEAGHPVANVGAVRFNPEAKAELTEFARTRIQMVWDDAGPVDAQTLAENVVAAQEWLWLSMHFPVESPSEVLAAVRREAAAEGAASALEDVAHEWGNKTWLQVLTQSLVTRAAEIRAGGNQ